MKRNVPAVSWRWLVFWSAVGFLGSVLLMFSAVYNVSFADLLRTANGWTVTLVPYPNDLLRSLAFNGGWLCALVTFFSLADLIWHHVVAPEHRDRLMNAVAGKLTRAPHPPIVYPRNDSPGRR